LIPESKFRKLSASLFIKSNVNIAKTITLGNGDVTMADNITIEAPIFCKRGTVKMGSNNEIVGDIYAIELKRGSNSDIKGKFFKTVVK